MEDCKHLDHLIVLYLPKSAPSITYRAWARGDQEFSVLRWYVQRLVEKHGQTSLIIACHDETDRVQAEAVTSDFGVYIAVCTGATPLEAMGQLAAAFPGVPIAYFQTEAVFAPSDLLDLVLMHHYHHENDFSFVLGLPPLLTPEVVSSALLSTLARVNYGTGAPSVREAVMRLRHIRPDIRAEPFQASEFYRLPMFTDFSPMLNRDDATRARQMLSGLPYTYAFEAIERWPDTTFEPVDFGFNTRPPQPDRTRVLYVSPGCVYSGAEECLRGLAQELGRLGFQQTAVVGAEGVLAERLRAVDCDVISANWQFSARNGPGVNERFAREVLDRVQPDVMHCNMDPGDAFLNVARARGTRVITHVRGVTSPDGTTRISCGDADHYIAVSGFMKRRLAEAGICIDKISVVYDGVDEDRFSPNVFDARQMRSEHNLPQDSLVVLMISRPVPQKRHDLMLDAFFRLRANIARTHLVFVGDFGDNAFLDAMRRQVTALQLTERVTWLPFQDDIRRIECASDLVVLPSDGEALGTCILEAMSLQKAVVVSDSGGSHELLEHEVSGLVVPGGNASALTAALQLLAGNPEFRAGLGISARRRVIERFTIRSHAEQVARVIRAVGRLTG